MAYNDEALRAKLSTLNETQESIVTVAQWILFHRRHADRTATLWLERVKESNVNKRLNLIYLANEVVQQSKARKRDDFVIAFSPFVPEAISIAFRGATGDIRGKIRRVVEVWRQRNIFDESIQAAAESRMKDLENTSLVGGKKLLGGSLFSNTPISNAVAPLELQPLITLHDAVAKAETNLSDIVSQAEMDAKDVTDTPDAAIPRRIARFNKTLKCIASAEDSLATAMDLETKLIRELEKLAASRRGILSQKETTLESLQSKAASIANLKQLDEDSIMRRLPPDEDELDGAQVSSNELTDHQDEGPSRAETDELTAPPVEDFTPTGSPELKAFDHDLRGQACFAVRGRELGDKIEPGAALNLPVPGADLLASSSRPFSATDMANHDEGSVKKPRLHDTDGKANADSRKYLADDLNDLIYSEGGRA